MSSRLLTGKRPSRFLPQVAFYCRLLKVQANPWRSGSRQAGGPSRAPFAGIGKHGLTQTFIQNGQRHAAPSSGEAGKNWALSGVTRSTGDTTKAKAVDTSSLKRRHVYTDKGESSSGLPAVRRRGGRTPGSAETGMPRAANSFPVLAARFLVAIRKLVLGGSQTRGGNFWLIQAMANAHPLFFDEDLSSAEIARRPSPEPPRRLVRNKG